LIGPEKLRLFSKLNIATQFPDLKHKEREQELWTMLLEINQLLSAKPSQMTDKLLLKALSHSKNTQVGLMAYPNSFYLKVYD